MQTTHDLTTRTLKVAELTFYPGNPRRGDIELLKRSLASHGQFTPIAVQASTGYVVKGNNTLRAAVELGWTTIEGTVLDVDDDQAKRILLIDNAASERGDFYGEDLAAILDSLGGDLADTGYDDGSLDTLLAQLSGEVPTMVTVAIDDLHPHPRNYQQHPEDQIEHLVTSIRETGYYRPIVVARDDTILAGHGVVEASRRMGRVRIPVIRLPLAPDDPAALRVLIGDNELNNLAEVDDRALTDMLQECLRMDTLTGTGFDETQLAALLMLTRPTSEMATNNADDEWVGMPGFEPMVKEPRLIITFETMEERARFVTEVKVQTTNALAGGPLWSGRWPARGRRDLSAVKFQ